MGAETRRIDLLNGNASSLLYLTVDGEKVIPSQQLLADHLGMSAANLSKILSVTSEHRQSCPPEKQPLILEAVRERLRRITNDEDPVVETVCKLFKDRFGNSKTIDLQARVNEQNAHLVRIGLDSRKKEGTASEVVEEGLQMKLAAESESPEIIEAVGILAAPDANLFRAPSGEPAPGPPVKDRNAGFDAKSALLIFLCCVAMIAMGVVVVSGFKGPNQKVQPTPLVPSGASVALYLEAPRSDYSRSTNQIFREYMHRMLRPSLRASVVILEQTPESEMDDEKAKEIKQRTSVRAVIWLSTVETSAGSRLYINNDTSFPGVESYRMASTLKKSDLGTFSSIDSQARGLFSIVAAELLEAYRVKGDFQSMRDLIDDAYDKDPELKRLGAFDIEEAYLLARGGNYAAALRLVEGYKVPSGLNVNDEAKEHMRWALEVQKAVLNYRLGRYERVYGGLSRLMGEPCQEEIVIWPRGAAFACQGVLFLKLAYPLGQAIIFRVNAKAFIVYEGPLTKFYDDALQDKDESGYMRSKFAELLRRQDPRLAPGVYHAKVESAVEGEDMVFRPKFLRNLRLQDLRQSQ